MAWLNLGQILVISNTPVASCKNPLELRFVASHKNPLERFWQSAVEWLDFSNAVLKSLPPARRIGQRWRATERRRR